MALLQESEEFCTICWKWLWLLQVAVCTAFFGLVSFAL